MKKLYLISIWKFEEETDEKVHNAIIKWSTDWWRYLPDTWIIEAKLSMKTIMKRIKESHTGIKFLFITRFDPKENTGWMPKDAWEWIKKHQA